MERKMVNFIREQYPPGTRIRLNAMDDPYAPILPGTEGEVDFVDDAGQLHMKWDNGRTLPLAPGEDSFTVLPPKLTTLKLYIPLTADLYERNEYGDFDDSSTLLEGRELRGYQDQITAALVKNRMPEETERGLMHWYDEADSVDRKVRSAVFTVEKRDRQLWGVAECRVAGELSDTELETLKEYLTGQASDGWGEGFEQREISMDDGGELYVHLWNSDEWSIQTEQELFSPKLAEGLPELCFSTLASTGELICIKRAAAGHGVRKHARLGGSRCGSLLLPAGRAADRRDEPWLKRYLASIWQSWTHPTVRPTQGWNCPLPRGNCTMQWTRCSFRRTRSCIWRSMTTTASNISPLT